MSKGALKQHDENVCPRDRQVKGGTRRERVEHGGRERHWTKTGEAREEGGGR